MEAGALLATTATAVPAAGCRHVALSIRAPIPSKSFRFPSDRHQRSHRRSGRGVRSRAFAVASEKFLASLTERFDIEETPVQQNKSSELDLFSCPIYNEPLIRKGPSGLNLASIYRSGFKCQKCDKSFSSKDVYLDITVTTGATEYNEFKPARTELFRSPLVSFLYERGWRQNFQSEWLPWS